MNNQAQTGASLSSLMRTLGSKDGLARQEARRALVALGRPAVPPLIRALRDSKMEQIRWEAAKALGSIGDPRAIPTLVRALEDEDPDVAWLAAEALQKLGKVAWPALLHALIQRGMSSAALREGTHHVFRDQREEGFEDLIVLLLQAIETETVPEMMITAAHQILEKVDTLVRQNRRNAVRAGVPVHRTP